MPNPFYRYLKPEDLFHIAALNYIRLQYPKAFVVHIPNEGRRTPFERYKAKMLGLQSGMPDIMIFNPIDVYNGLALELKVGDNKSTPIQVKMQKKLEENGWRVEECRTIESVIQTVNVYFSL